MNNLPVETRIDILAGAVCDLADAIELLIDKLPPAGREDDYGRIVRAYETANKQAKRCMEV